MPDIWFLKCGHCGAEARSESGYDFLRGPGDYMSLGATMWTRVLDDEGITRKQTRNRLFLATDYVCLTCNKWTRHRRLWVYRPVLLSLLLEWWRRFEGPRRPHNCPHCGSADLGRVHDVIVAAGPRIDFKGRYDTETPLKFLCPQCNRRSLELGMPLWALHNQILISERTALLSRRSNDSPEQHDGPERP